MCAFIYYISLWACLAHKTTPMKRTLAIFYILFIACFASYAGVKTKRFQFIGKHYTRSGREHNESITRVIFHQGGSSPVLLRRTTPSRGGKLVALLAERFQAEAQSVRKERIPRWRGWREAPGGDPKTSL